MRHTLFILVVAAGCIVAREARADAPSPTPRPDMRSADCLAGCAQPCCTEVTVVIPIWIPGISGTLGSGTSDVGVDRPDREIFEASRELEFAFLGEVHVRRGRWSFAVDGFGSSVSSSATFTLNGQPATSANLWEIILRGRIGYSLWDTCFRGPCGMPSRFRAGPYVGARFYWTGFDAETAGGGLSVDEERNWADPIVGFEAQADLGKRWSVHAMTDVGGFGAGSELSWWFSAYVQFRISCHFAIRAGWQVLDVRRETGSGATRFEWDVNLSGPMLGLAIVF